jgi:hypothetical protein
MGGILYIGGGYLNAQPKGKGAGKAMLKHTHDIFQEVATRTQKPLFHHESMLGLPASNAIYKNNGYIDLVKSGKGKLFFPKSDEQRKLLSLHHESAIRLLLGEKRYLETKPEK